jgi:hypothetical protein
MLPVCRDFGPRTCYSPLCSPVPQEEGEETDDQLAEASEADDGVSELSAPVPTTHVRAPSDDKGANRVRQLAESRGLSLNTSPSADLRARRASRIPGQAVVGLPTSPRPGHRHKQGEAPAAVAEQPPSPRGD